MGRAWLWRMPQATNGQASHCCFSVSVFSFSEIWYEPFWLWHPFIFQFLLSKCCLWTDFHVAVSWICWITQRTHFSHAHFDCEHFNQWTNSWCRFRLRRLSRKIYISQPLTGSVLITSPSLCASLYMCWSLLLPYCSTHFGHCGDSLGQDVHGNGRLHCRAVRHVLCVVREKTSVKPRVSSPLRSWRRVFTTTMWQNWLSTGRSCSPSSLTLKGR